MNWNGSFVGVIALAAIAVMLFVVFGGANGGTLDPRNANPVLFGDAVEQNGLNWVSYIVGPIPDFLIDWTNRISAAIIVFSLFVMFFVVFSDILDLFGTFSSKSISYLVGFVLTVIVANLKVLMYVAVWAMILTSGLGVLAATVGIAVPFILFIALHILLLGNLKHYFKKKKDNENFETGANDLAAGISGLKAFGKAVRGDGKGKSGGSGPYYS